MVLAVHHVSKLRVCEWGLLPDGLFPYGLFPNGLFPNGLFLNCSFSNGLYPNAPIQKDLFLNSLFPNGLFLNSLFPNGSFPNGLFPNGLLLNCSLLVRHGVRHAVKQRREGCGVWRTYGIFESNFFLHFWLVYDDELCGHLRYFDSIACWISDPTPKLLILYTCNQLVSRHLKMTNIYFWVCLFSC